MLRLLPPKSNTPQLRLHVSKILHRLHLIPQIRWWIDWVKHSQNAEDSSSEIGLLYDTLALGKPLCLLVGLLGCQAPVPFTNAKDTDEDDGDVFSISARQHYISAFISDIRALEASRQIPLGEVMRVEDLLGGGAPGFGRVLRTVGRVIASLEESFPGLYILPAATVQDGPFAGQQRKDADEWLEKGQKDLLVRLVEQEKLHLEMLNRAYAATTLLSTSSVLSGDPSLESILIQHEGLISWHQQVLEGLLGVSEDTSHDYVDWERIFRLDDRLTAPRTLSPYRAIPTNWLALYRRIISARQSRPSSPMTSGPNSPTPLVLSIQLPSSPEPIQSPNEVSEVDQAFEDFLNLLPTIPTRIFQYVEVLRELLKLTTPRSCTPPSPSPSSSSYFTSDSPTLRRISLPSERPQGPSRKTSWSLLNSLMRRDRKDSNISIVSNMSSSSSSLGSRASSSQSIASNSTYLPGVSSRSVSQSPEIWANGLGLVLESESEHPRPEFTRSRLPSESSISSSTSSTSTPRAMLSPSGIGVCSFDSLLSAINQFSEIEAGLREIGKELRNMNFNVLASSLPSVMAFLGGLGGESGLGAGPDGMGDLVFDDIASLLSSPDGADTDPEEEVAVFLFEGGLACCRFGASPAVGDNRRYPINEWEYGYGLRTLLHASSAFSVESQDKPLSQLAPRTHARAHSRASRYGHVAAMTVVSVIRKDELLNGHVRIFQSEGVDHPAQIQIQFFDASQSAYPPTQVTVAKRESLIFRTAHPEQTKQWIQVLTSSVARVEKILLPLTIAEEPEDLPKTDLVPQKKNSETLSIHSTVSDASVMSQTSGTSYDPEPMVHPYDHSQFPSHDSGVAFIYEDDLGRTGPGRTKPWSLIARRGPTSEASSFVQPFSDSESEPDHGSIGHASAADHPVNGDEEEDGEQEGLETSRPNISMALLPNLTSTITKEDRFPAAHGGFADIWRGTLQQSSNERLLVAVKVIRGTGNGGQRSHFQFNDSTSSFSSNQSGHRGAQRELRLAHELNIHAALNHPNILPLLGVVRGWGSTELGETASLPVSGMVYPWQEHGSASRWIEGYADVLEIKDRLKLICDVAQGLKYLHANSIIHGDLSGSNILITATGNAMLCDFGMSRILAGFSGVHPDEAQNGDENQTRWILGGAIRWADISLYNTSLEPRAVLSKASDVYSFGSVMLEILTSRIPYHYLKSDAQVIMQLHEGTRPRRPIVQLVNEEQWDLIQQCWRTVQSERLDAEMVLSRVRGMYDRWHS